MTATLDPAKAEDYSTVEALIQKAGLPVDGLRDQFPNGYVLARQDGRIVGVAGLEAYGFVGLLRSLVVVEDARHRGLGRELVQDRLTAARKSRMAAVYLLTTSAAPFFRALGFVDSERSSLPRALSISPEVSRGCPASASCLMLMIE